MIPYFFDIGTVYFNSKHGCQKCTTIGIFYPNAKRVAFPDFNMPKRTDADFRNQKDPLHHKERSPLKNMIGKDGTPLLDMIKTFPSSDPLHLTDEGVMKRSLQIWIKGSSKYKNKWSEQQKNELNKLILLCNKELPGDMNRQVRILKYIKYYKATEFRTILLYIGMVIFKDLLEDGVYEHVRVKPMYK